MEFETTKKKNRMKLEDYQTPETDIRIKMMKDGHSRHVPKWEDFARNLERRLCKANTVLMGIAYGMELMKQNPRTVKLIREALTETHRP
jgi:hypothetical protein